MKIWIIGAWLLVTPTVSSAGAFTIESISSGFYADAGWHRPGNYAAGWFVSTPSAETRNYFVFDLTSVFGTIVSANLHLSTAPPGFVKYGSNDPSEIYTLFDVSTSLSTLTTGTGGVSTFNDLGGGTVYGGVSVDDSLGLTIDVPLNAAGVAFLQGRTGKVAVGGAITTLAKGISGEFLFNATNASLTRQLVITTTPTPVPEPSIFLLAAAGALIGVPFLRKRRRD